MYFCREIRIGHRGPIMIPASNSLAALGVTLKDNDTLA